MKSFFLDNRFVSNSCSPTISIPAISSLEGVQCNANTVVYHNCVFIFSRCAACARFMILSPKTVNLIMKDLYKSEYGQSLENLQNE